MISVLMSVLLFMSPLLPEQLPANQIYMGEHLQPISGDRIKCKSATGFCMTLTLKGFLRAKDAIQNQPNLCQLAVDQTATACRVQAEALAVVVSQREQDDQQLINSYKLKLKHAESTLAQVDHQRIKWRWAALGVSSLSAILTTIMIIRL